MRRSSAARGSPIAHKMLGRGGDLPDSRGGFPGTVALIFEGPFAHCCACAFFSSPDATESRRCAVRHSCRAGGRAGAAAEGFKFSEQDDADRAESEARQSRIAEQLSTPCRADLKGKKIMVVIGERAVERLDRTRSSRITARISRRSTSGCAALGLRTYTPEEIRRQIAQAEIDAYFRNDPDAALSASRRLGASFVLRGLISSQATTNPMMAVNQVSVNMGFTLTGSNGRHDLRHAKRSRARMRAPTSQRMALTLVNEKADEVVATLYADYCRNAGLGGARKPRAEMRTP